jgi:hypothetical protein
LKKPELKFSSDTGEVGTKFDGNAVQVPPEYWRIVPFAPYAQPSVELTMKTENRLFDVVPGLTGPDHMPVE